MQKIKKNLMSGFWENYKNIDFGPILPCFAAIMGEEEFFQKIELCYFSVFMIP